MILPPGTHCSRLSRNGSHMSTHTASIPFRWRLVNSVRKYSSSVSFLRSFPNHNGSAVSRLHTTVRNLSRFPWYSSSTPMCRNGGFRRLASQRSKYRRSMPRTVLCARPIRRATCRAAALSQDCPTVLKPFAVGRLAGQLRHLLRLHSARRAIHPIQFHHHRGLILKARQIPDLSFIHLVHLVHPSSAARTGHAAIPPLAPDPQLELLVLFVDLLLIDPIARESQHLPPSRPQCPAQFSRTPAPSASRSNQPLLCRSSMAKRMAVTNVGSSQFSGSRKLRKSGRFVRFSLRAPLSITRRPNNPMVPIFSNLQPLPPPPTTNHQSFQCYPYSRKNHVAQLS